MKNRLKQKVKILFTQRTLSWSLAIISLIISLGAIIPATPLAASTLHEDSSARVIRIGTNFAVGESPNYDQDKSDIKKDCEDPNINKDCRIVDYLFVFINILSAVFAIVIIIVTIVAGIQYSASAGDSQAAAAAKKRITNVLIAMVAYASMYGFLQWIIPGGIF